jgi:hypothetical protein
MSVPQLEIQPFSPEAAVPGAPVADSEMVQNSLVTPHWPCRFYMRGGLAVAEYSWGQRDTYTTSIKRTLIQAGKSNTWSRLGTSGLLRTTDGVGNRSRHRRCTSTQANVLKSLHVGTALPAPSFSVKALYLSVGQTVDCSQGRAAIAGLDIV